MTNTTINLKPGSLYSARFLGKYKQSAMWTVQSVSLRDLVLTSLHACELPAHPFPPSASAFICEHICHV